MQHSAIYSGELRHRRSAPVRHDFRQRIFMLYLDLDELSELTKGTRFWRAVDDEPTSRLDRLTRWARFRRADYFGDPDVSLGDCVRATVERETGWRPSGPIRMLAHGRYFGICFNPLAVYYCFDDHESTVGPGDCAAPRAVVADVTNTPWGQRHQYVFGLPERADQGRGREPGRLTTATVDKRIHVSPFNPMDIQYRWRSNAPGKRLFIHMDLLNGGEKFFDATLSLRREPINSRALDRVLVRFPMMTAHVIGNIYWQALKLRIKGAQFHDNPHPRTQQPYQQR